MNPDFTDLARLRHLQEQDEAECLAWLQDATSQDQIAVWLAIQKLGGPGDTLNEVVSRFAQLGFTHGVLLAAEGRHEP